MCLAYLGSRRNKYQFPILHPEGLSHFYPPSFPFPYYIFCCAIETRLLLGAFPLFSFLVLGTAAKTSPVQDRHCPLKYNFCLTEQVR